ncbi:MAG: DUF29 domain-containing protein [Rhodospirillaceae bacterium]
MISSLYESDFYAWANEQAALLRAGQLTVADIEHIAEEIESMGKTEKREMVNRLAVLLMHLLKWRYQPERRGSSWRTTIRVQRLALKRHLLDNPSLKSKREEVTEDGYSTALIEAAGETGLPEESFPPVCPWSFEQVIDEKFWPGEPE